MTMGESGPPTPRIFGDVRNDLVDTLAGHKPLIGDAAKLAHWQQEEIGRRRAEHPRRAKIGQWAMCGFFVLLGLALLAFLILFPIFVLR